MPLCAGLDTSNGAFVTRTQASLAELALSVLREIEMAVFVCAAKLDRAVLSNLAAEAFFEGFGSSLGETLPLVVRTAIVELLEQRPEKQFSRPLVVAWPTGRRFLMRAKRLAGRRVLVTATLQMVRERDLLEILVERFALSHRECEVVALVRSGFSNEEVARRLHLSSGTVKQYLHTIFVTMGTHSRAELIAAVERLAREGS